MKASIPLALLGALALGSNPCAAADSPAQPIADQPHAASVGFTPAPTKMTAAISQKGLAMVTPARIPTVVVPGEPDFAKNAQRAHGKPGTAKH